VPAVGNSPEQANREVMMSRLDMIFIVIALPLQ
jgi:hypothetical protein